MTAPGMSSTLYIHVLHIPFGRDRLFERDYGRDGAP